MRAPAADSGHWRAEAGSPQRVPASSRPTMTSRVSQPVDLSACPRLWHGPFHVERPRSDCRARPSSGRKEASGPEGGVRRWPGSPRAIPTAYPSTYATPRPGLAGRDGLASLSRLHGGQVRVLSMRPRDVANAPSDLLGWRRWRLPAPPPVIAGAVAGGVAVAEAPFFARLRQVRPVVASGWPSSSYLERGPVFHVKRRPCRLHVARRRRLSIGTNVARSPARPLNGHSLGLPDRSGNNGTDVDRRVRHLHQATSRHTWRSAARATGPG